MAAANVLTTAATEGHQSLGGTDLYALGKAALGA